LCNVLSLPHTRFALAFWKAPTKTLLTECSSLKRVWNPCPL